MEMIFTGIMKDEKYYKNLDMKIFYPELEADAGDLAALVQDGYFWDGSHHKDWFFEQIAAHLGIPLPKKEEKGIAP